MQKTNEWLDKQTVWDTQLHSAHTQISMCSSFVIIECEKTIAGQIHTHTHTPKETVRQIGRGYVGLNSQSVSLVT